MNSHWLRVLRRKGTQIKRRRHTCTHSRYPMMPFRNRSWETTCCSTMETQIPNVSNFLTWRNTLAYCFKCHTLFCSEVVAWFLKWQVTPCCTKGNWRIFHVVSKPRYAYTLDFGQSFRYKNTARYLISRFGRSDFVAGGEKLQDVMMEWNLYILSWTQTNCTRPNIAKVQDVVSKSSRKASSGGEHHQGDAGRRQTRRSFKLALTDYSMPRLHDLRATWCGKDSTRLHHTQDN